MTEPTQPTGPLGQDPNPVDLDAVSHQIAIAMAGMRDVFKPIDEAVTGYRRQLEGEGWSPPAAEAMAVGMHQVMTAQLITATVTGKGETS
ncbi:hypothetical protein [Actinomadura sp. GTD37]|uniref:hypothetical protein n=1 Tax=Actinomadura sp. GTD37 TaxID=1778030 RepID=UPI0035BED3CB